MADEPAKDPKDRDIESIVKGAVESAIKAVRTDVIAPLEAEFKKLSGRHEELAGQTKVLADTMAALPPAGVKKPGETETPPPAVTADDIKKQVAAELKARDDAVAADAQNEAAKKTLRENVIKAKLGGDAELGAVLPDTGDEAALNAAADALASKIKTFKPDFGGTAANGGVLPTEKPPAELNANLTPGTAARAAAMTLPK